MLNIKAFHKKLLAVGLGVIGFLIIVHKLMSEQSRCSAGEICEGQPPHDWKLKPYNGFEEDHPLRRRFWEENRRGDDAGGHSIGTSRSYGNTKEDNFIHDMFEVQDKPLKELAATKIEIKVKEIYVPQPCETEMNLTHRQYIRNCITNEIIGKISPDIQNIPFSAHEMRLFPVKENARERQRSFQQVYETNAWGKNWDPGYKDMNGSGRGATLSWTQELTAALHTVINKIKETLGLQRVRLLDIPCGDMAWMSRFLITRDDIDYTGIDIVPELIQHHRKAYKSYPWKFMKVDLLETPLNETYHLILSRMLLQHLYFRDVTSLLSQFSQSGSSFLLTTTFPGVQSNEELVTDTENPGRVRKLNLEIPPISLSAPYCYQRDGPSGDFEGWKHFIGLWKLPLTKVRDCLQVYSMGYPRQKKVKIHSCTKWS